MTEPASVAIVRPPPPAANGHRRLRLALVVQRYGVEISGGSELMVRQLALRLAAFHDIEVLTSCAVDYTTWSMHYAPGLHQVEGIGVRRFPHPRRNDLGRARVPRVHKLRIKASWLFDALPGPRVAQPRGDPEYDGNNFLRRQGPHCPDLLQHLAAHRADYDAAIFFTALYEPTALGLPLWGPRSLLVPTLHDEKAMHLPIFHRVFRAAGQVFYLTAAEQRVAQALYGLLPEPGQVVGLGISAERPPQHVIDETRHRLGLPQRYFVYVGRVDAAKGCDKLVRAFAEFSADDAGMGLVMVGQPFMPLQATPRVICTGYIAEGDRDAVVSGATALMMPSRFESLSMVLLEAMRLGVPVVANAQCDVLADHIVHSRGGYTYGNQRELVGLMRRLAQAAAPARRALGDAGRAYVESRYTWPRVIEQYCTALNRVAA